MAGRGGFAANVRTAYILCMSQPPAPSDEAFFSTLSEVVFGNPFTTERTTLIRRLAPNAPSDITRDREALARVVAAKLESFSGSAALSRLNSEHRRLIEPALLYVAYHRYVPQLDAHIERQAKQGGEPLAVPFGEEAVR